MTTSEHIAGIFVGGCYYFFTGSLDKAEMLWRTALQVRQLRAGYRMPG